MLVKPDLATWVEFVDYIRSVAVGNHDLVAFDIGPDNEPLAAILQVGEEFSRLYYIDLASGDATDLGQIGRGELVVGLSIQVGPDCVAVQ